jgi:serine/threonine-protein phosphatase 6 regulatory ankyrin repeat subunit B
MEVVKLLIQNGADIKSSSASAPSWHAEKWTILHGAVYGGNKDMVEFLIDKGADINARDSVDRSPFHIALNEGYGEVAKLLDKTDSCVLSIAASLGDREVVKRILEDKSEEERVIITNPEKEGKRGPLHFAANCGSLEVVKLLVENGADISSSANDGFTPLHMAASDGYSDVVEFIVEEAIKKGHDKSYILKVSDRSGWTVLHSAAKSGYTEIVRFLINKFSKDKEKSSRALINAADAKGTTLLHTAAFHGNLGTVEFLIEKKANVNAVDIYGATPLFAAAMHSNFKVVEYLLETKETRVYCDSEKVLGMLDITSLHAAAAYDNLDIAELLLKNGSRVNAGEKGSLTPLHVAAFFDSSKVIELLVDKSASTDVLINFSNIVNVLDFVKNDFKGGYGSQSIDHVITCCKFFKIPFVGDFIGSQFTPRMISTALKYNNKLVQRDVSGQLIRPITAKILSLPFLLPWVEKQVRMVKAYVESKKSGQSAPPIGESFMFHDISS